MQTRDPVDLPNASDLSRVGASCGAVCAGGGRF
jgi:hypothetical protein